MRGDEVRGYARVHACRVAATARVRGPHANIHDEAGPGHLRWRVGTGISGYLPLSLLREVWAVCSLRRVLDGLTHRPPSAHGRTRQAARAAGVPGLPTHRPPNGNGSAGQARRPSAIARLSAGAPPSSLPCRSSARSPPRVDIVPREPRHLVQISPVQVTEGGTRRALVTRLSAEIFDL